MPYPGNAVPGKPVAVLGATTGMFGATWAQADLRRVLTTMGACVLDSGLSVAAAHCALASEGGLRDPEAAVGLRAIVSELSRRTAGRAA